MDSPGHSTQFCSNTFMENGTKKILCVITMDKRVTERKSTNLEKASFLKGMQFLKDLRFKAVEVVMDAHPEISALMSKYVEKFFQTVLSRPQSLCNRSV